MSFQLSSCRSSVELIYKSFSTRLNLIFFNLSFFTSSESRRLAWAWFTQTFFLSFWLWCLNYALSCIGRRLQMKLYCGACFSISSSLSFTSSTALYSYSLILYSLSQCPNTKTIYRCRSLHYTASINSVWDKIALYCFCYCQIRLHIQMGNAVQFLKSFNL